MAVNGNGKALEERERDLREADRTLERLQAEYERIGSQIEAYYEQPERAAAQLAAAQGMRRRTMSARAKSDYITEHGIEAYQRLKW